MTVGCGTRDDLAAHDAVGAAAAVDNHLLVQFVGEAVGDQAADGVGGAGDCSGNEAHGFAGELLRKSRIA